MCVSNGLEDTRACLQSLRTTTEPFRLIVMDNGSTDGTPEFFRRFPHEYPLTFARSPGNDGVIAALNRAWRLADTEFVCFLHNDTEMLDPSRERADIVLRDSALARFAEKYRRRLPCDVRGPSERMRDWLKVRFA